MSIGADAGHRLLQPAISLIRNHIPNSIRIIVQLTSSPRW
jgi:Na+-transporting NADH:ubiquinone oxidoreductase subunit NqrD